MAKKLSEESFTTEVMELVQKYIKNKTLSPLQIITSLTVGQVMTYKLYKMQTPILKVYALLNEVFLSCYNKLGGRDDQGQIKRQSD